MQLFPEDKRQKEAVGGIGVVCGENFCARWLLQLTAYFAILEEHVMDNAEN